MLVKNNADNADNAGNAGNAGVVIKFADFASTTSARWFFLVDLFEFHNVFYLWKNSKQKSL
jgi:hypothetical protein